MFDGKTFVLGVIGDPISHSLSPVMHNRAIQHLELNYCYLPFHVKTEDLEEGIKGVKSLNIKGINVTSPHKEKVIDHLDKLSQDAKNIGAVNTIVREGDGLAGYNTDGEGFVESIKEKGFNPKGKIVAIIGTGGAAKSVGYSLLKHDVSELRIINRTLEKAENLAGDLKGYCDKDRVNPLELNQEKLKGKLGGVDLVINGLPMDPVTEAGDWMVPLNELKTDGLAVDFRYKPRESGFLKACREKGLETMNGSMMLLYQGVIAFEYFTSQKAPVEEMKKSLLENT